MKNFLKLFMAFAIICMLASCNKNEDKPDTPVVPDVPERPTCTDAVQIHLDAVTPETITCTFDKVDSCTNYHILCCEPSSQEMFFPMFGFTSWEQATAAWGLPCVGDTTYTWDEMIPNTEYVIFVLAHFATHDTLIKDTVLTTTLGGHGTSSIALEVKDITSTGVTTIATPNSETAMFKDFIISKEYYDEIGHDSTMALLKADYYEHYSVDTWTWFDLTSNTEYIFAGIGKNADGQWGEMNMISFTTTAKKRK